MNRLLRISLVLVGLISMLLTAGQAEEVPDVPLAAPKAIIKITPPPADMKPKISRGRAIELAGRYSGFELGKNVKAELVLYSDTELYHDAERIEFPYREPTLTWLVYLPDASFKRERYKARPEVVRCPLHVGIHANTGMLLGAYGDSREKWTRGPDGASDGYSGLSFCEPDQPPKLTVRHILESYAYRTSTTGQFFIRYVTITSANPVRVATEKDPETHRPPYRGWFYLQRGVLNRGFSVPLGYKGPPLYNTNSEDFMNDDTGKPMGGGTW